MQIFMISEESNIPFNNQPENLDKDQVGNAI